VLVYVPHLVLRGGMGMGQRKNQDGNWALFQRTNECCKTDMREEMKMDDGRNGIGEGRGLVERRNLCEWASFRLGFRVRLGWSETDVSRSVNFSTTTPPLALCDADRLFCGSSKVNKLAPGKRTNTCWHYYSYPVFSLAPRSVLTVGVGGLKNKGHHATNNSLGFTNERSAVRPGQPGA
jgi:hypothetical protein